jgi:23S rRNA pseudouridine1911/1915/1917 synthase
MGALQNNESPPHDPVESVRTLYGDDTVVVIDKPAGMHVFPSREREQAVLTYILQQWPEMREVGDQRFPAVAHRLDRGTSGLLLVARTNNAYQALRTMFRRGLVRKTYLALVEGEIPQPCSIDLPIGARHRRSRKVVVADHESDRRTLHSLQKAMTSIYPLGSACGFSFCRIEMTTGVRHQIRAHLSYLGHPIVGDTLYGATQTLPETTDRFFLHAWRLDLAHPINQRALSFTCPLPVKLTAVIIRLGLPLPK